MGYDPSVAESFADSTWKVKHKLELDASEAKKVEAEQKRREKLKSEGTLTAQAEYYAYVVMDFVKENPWVILAPIGLLVWLIMYCVRAPSASNVSKKEDEDEEEEEQEQEGEGEVQGEEKESPKASPKASPIKSDIDAEGIRKRKNPKVE